MHLPSEHDGDLHFDFSPVSQTVTLESDLVAWLDRESKKLKASPSVVISTLLEWARDENILGGDPSMFPQVASVKKKRARARG